MASPRNESAGFQTPTKQKSSTSPLNSPSSISTTSTHSKQRSITDNSTNNDETITTIKMEEGTDEVKVFSASAIKKHEPDDDIDVDGIEDRLSPVVEEPTSPNKNDPLASGISSLYTSPFLYPYFHPMFHPYLMAAAAQANAAASSTPDKPAVDGAATNPYGAAAATPLSPFSGFNPAMPFPPLYPSGMVNQPFRPNLFNPFGIPIPTPGVRPPTSGPAAGAPPSGSSSSSSSSSRHPSTFDGPSRNLSALLDAQRPKKPHIKKPLNAFMLYMKEQRARVIEECTLKESSAINKVLGQKWKELPRSEQDRYYELAKEERNRHMQMYPGWSARDNYGLKKKRQGHGHSPLMNTSHKKAPRENNSMVNSPGHLNPNSPHRFGTGHHLINSPHLNSTKNPMQLEDCLNQKKCRARFGLEGQSQWCKHCRRKKKCTRFLEDDFSNHPNNPMLNPYSHPNLNNHGSHGGSSHGNPSSLGSPTTLRSDNDDSINDLDGDDILARQIDSIEDDDDENDEGDDRGHQTHDDDSDEENKQQHHQPVSLVYKPNASKHESHHSSALSATQPASSSSTSSSSASSTQHNQPQSGHHFSVAPPPPAHLYQPSLIPSHFAPGFHY